MSQRYARTGARVSGKQHRSRCRWRRCESGFTYIALLIMVAIMGVWLAATAEVWSMALKRDKEDELLFAGNQLRNAITMYYTHAPGPGNRYPAKLEDLLKDPRYPGTKRYLRKIYLDPVANGADWDLIKGPNGEILGVHSSSDEEPAKKSSFSLADQTFEDKAKYSDWEFAISPKYFPLAAVANPPGVPFAPPAGAQLVPHKAP